MNQKSHLLYFRLLVCFFMKNENMLGVFKAIVHPTSALQSSFGESVGSMLATIRLEALDLCALYCASIKSCGHHQARVGSGDGGYLIYTINVFI